MVRRRSSDILAWILLVGVFAAFVLAFARSVAAAEDTKPALTVWMERGDLLAGQTMKVRVWVQNPTDATMTGPDGKELVLHFDASEYLKLGQVDGNGGCVSAAEGLLDVTAKLDPHSGTLVPLELCLRANSSIHEEDVNLAFSLPYVLEARPDAENPQGMKRADVAVVEEKVSVSLLGSDAVGGLSLKLLTFCLPGMLFFFLLKLVKHPWAEQVSGATEYSLATVGLSMAIWLSMQVLALAPAFFGWHFLANRQEGVGVSLLSLGLNTVLAAALALGVIGLWACDNHRKNKEEEKARKHKAAVTFVPGVEEMRPKDYQIAIAASRERQSTERPKAVLVSCAKGKFAGAAASLSDTKGLLLIGWLKISAPDADLFEGAKTLLTNLSYEEALALPGVTIDFQYKIMRIDGSVPQRSEWGFLYIPAEDNPRIVEEPYHAPGLKPDEEPVRLAPLEER